MNRAKTIIEKGYSPAMRDLKRQQGISLSTVHETFYGDKSENRSLTYCPTDEMIADGFTKSFKEVPKWKTIVELMGMRSFKENPAE